MRAFDDTLVVAALCADKQQAGTRGDGWWYKGMAQEIFIGVLGCVCVLNETNFYLVVW